MALDFSPYAVGGAAARPDSFSGLADPFSQALMAMLHDAPEDVRVEISSAYRSPETQERLWQDALKKYGSEAEARKWVAPPGRSQHNHGNAADLKFVSPAAREWIHANADRYGLSFPLSNEDWHIELAGARGSGRAPNALGVGTPRDNALTATTNTPSTQSMAFATREAPQWVGLSLPPDLTIEPLALPARRRV